MISEKILIGKKIKSIELNGYGIKLITEDGYILVYDASDGGYSTWDVKKQKE